MAETDWNDEIESAQEDAPQPIIAELPEIKLFGKWSCDDVNVADMSLQVIYLLSVANQFANSYINFYVVTFITLAPLKKILSS